jgi:regulator of sigma E protease
MIILIFILCFSFLVIAHEFGHFLLAKKNGVKVEEFGIGFPPKIIGKKIGDTVYSINAIPIGGFVRILGEEGGELGNPQSFSSKSLGQKVGILAAGVITNLIVAGLIFSILFTIGLPLDVADQKTLKADEKPQIVIANVEKGSPAQMAGLKVGDVVIKITDSQGIETRPLRLADFQNIISENKTKLVTIEILRQNNSLQLKAVPRVSYNKNSGSLGLSLMELVYYRYPLPLAFFEGFKRVITLAGDMLVGLFVAMRNWFTQGEAPEVSGPIGIASLSVQMAQIGWRYFFNFLAFLSTNLAIINILPLPALDGGRIILAISEKIRRKPFPFKIVAAINGIGLILLLLLSFLIAIKDVARINTL